MLSKQVHKYNEKNFIIQMLFHKKSAKIKNNNNKKKKEKEIEGKHNVN